jgi:transmembrane sensor
MSSFVARHSSDTAEIDTIHLADNSEIILAPQSAVRVTYGATERHVDLLRGEAFFEVAHNAKRPFRVGINDVTVTVVGTGFDIRKGSSRTEVAVAHGVVRVANAPGGASGQSTSPTETLRAGQSVAVSDRGAMARGILPVSQVAAWRNHQLIAQDQPLGEVVDRLRPYFDGKIFLVDDGLAARPVTGVYNLDDPLQALRGILRAQNARLRQILPWVMIVSAS